MGEAPRDSLRILIATDNHLGFAERDPVRGDDSFETFEEILSLGAEAKVDFILLGGDLFHENKPSRQCVVRCMDLLRKYTFGDRPVLFDFLSDPAENFQHSKNPIPNYLDPNLNVSIPVFSIHGNHDDPSGLGSHCALEMLSTAGLINYFGRAKDLNRIEISPILLQKGRTKLALYGLCSLKDERLFRLFADEKVSMLRPHEDTDDWFNIFVLHQNHTKHGSTNYIPEAFLHSFLDLVVWGHEHECIINPQLSGDNNFHIIQPGSSVVTSLCASEAVEKKVAILEVTHEKKFRVDIHKLKTVRPFVIEDFSLVDNNLQDALEVEVKSYIKDKIDEMVIKAEEQHTGHPKQPKKPLVRLRVLYTNERQLFNGIQVGQLFEDIVANPTDIILFKKEGETRKKESEFNEEVMDTLFEAKAMKARVEDLVEKYFAEVDEKRQLSLLTERGLALSVKNFIDKDDLRAVADIVAHQTKKMMSYLKEEGVEADDDVVLERINEHRQQRMVRKNQKQMEEEAAAVINDPKRERSRKAHGSDDDDEEEEDAFIDDDIEEIQVKPARGRGSRGGRARGGRGSRAASRAASSSASTSSSRGKRNTKPQLDMSSIGSPKSTSRGSRGRGPSASRQSTLLDYSQKSQRTSSKSRGVIFDSDSD